MGIASCMFHVRNLILMNGRPPVSLACSAGSSVTGGVGGVGGPAFPFPLALAELSGAIDGGVLSMGGVVCIGGASANDWCVGSPARGLGFVFVTSV